MKHILLGLFLLVVAAHAKSNSSKIIYKEGAKEITPKSNPIILSDYFSGVAVGDYQIIGIAFKGNRGGNPKVRGLVSRGKPVVILEKEGSREHINLSGLKRKKDSFSVFKYYFPIEMEFTDLASITLNNRQGNVFIDQMGLIVAQHK